MSGVSALDQDMAALKVTLPVIEGSGSYSTTISVSMLRRMYDALTAARTRPPDLIDPEAGVSPTGGGWDTGKVPLNVCPDPAAHAGADAGELRRLRDIEHAARDVDGLWTEARTLIHWQVEAAEALLDLRAALDENDENPHPSVWAGLPETRWPAPAEQWHRLVVLARGYPPDEDDGLARSRLRVLRDLILEMAGLTE